MDRIALLIDEVERSLSGDAWHGPALAEALADVPAPEAALRLHAGTHSIWEIASHAAGWMEEVARRLRGGTPGLPAAGDWPEAAEPDEATWRQVLDRLSAAGADVTAALEAFDAERLGTRVGTADRDAPTGTGVSYEMMVHGLAQHNAYHAGQVMLLKRALRAQAVPPS